MAAPAPVQLQRPVMVSDLVCCVFVYGDYSNTIFSYVLFTDPIMRIQYNLFSAVSNVCQFLDCDCSVIIHVPDIFIFDLQFHFFESNGQVQGSQ